MPGPYIQVATFCAHALQERDGTLSVIRAIDTVTLSAPAQAAPPELPEGGTLATTLVVALKPDDARGRHPLTIRPEAPSGAYLPAQTFDMTFAGEERGVNLVLNLSIQVVEGLYWFDVLVNEVLLTRIPLRIIYQRVPHPA
jgi:hypothetical protein